MILILFRLIADGSDKLKGLVDSISNKSAKQRQAKFIMKDQDKQKIANLDQLKEMRQRISNLEVKHMFLKKALNHEKDKKKIILDNLQEHVIFHDMELRVLWANRAACESVGMTVENLVGRNCYEIWAKRSDQCEDCPLKVSREIGQPHALKKMTRDGRFWYIKCIPTTDSEGEITGMIEITVEVTEQKAEAALQHALDTLELHVEERTSELLKTNAQLKQEVEERKQAEVQLGEQRDFLNTLLETIPNPVFYKDVRGRYSGCNRAFEDFIGKPRLDIVGKTVYNIGPKEIADKYYEMDLALFEKPGKQHYEWQIKRADGALRDVIFDKATIKDSIGNVVGLVGVISDITERKRIEYLVRNLSHMLIETQEVERKMISYELHDCIAQNLSYLKISCDTFFDNQSEISTELTEKMGKQSKLIEQTIIAVRELSYGLHPPSLDQLGITQTIFQLCEEFSDFTGLSVDFVPTGMETLRHDPSLEINIYRLIQEGLNNIRKHADANHVKIVLVASYPNIILRIEDDGKGFDVKAREAELDGKKRMGLRSMTERVNLLQGLIKIKSRPKRGTKIFIKIPFMKGKRNCGSEKTHHNYRRPSSFPRGHQNDFKSKAQV